MDESIQITVLWPLMPCSLVDGCRGLRGTCYLCCQSAERNVNVYNGKGKAVPLQAWSGPEASRKLRFPGFMTTAQDGGKVVSLTHRPPLPPGNTSGTHFC